MLHSGVSSVLSAWGVRSKSISRSLPGAALGFSLHHIPLLGSLSSSLEWPSLGRKQSCSTPALSPWATRGFWAPNTGNSPLCTLPVSGHPPQPSGPSQAGKVPTQVREALQCPSRIPSHAGQRQLLSAQGARFPGARTLWGNYRKCREKPWSFPIWSRRPQRSGCRRKGAAELESRTRARRLHAPLPRQRVSPPPPGARPFSGGPAPPGGPLS